MEVARSQAQSVKQIATGCESHDEGEAAVGGDGGGVYRETNQVFVDGVLVFEAAIAGSPTWSPDGRWLIVTAADGIHFLDTQGNTAPVALDIGPDPEDQALVIFSST